MCGITGLLNLDGRPADGQLLARMRDALIHRGPDSAGLYLDGPLGLGHRRLAIIDLTDVANQPLSNETGTVWLIYNGEIYNFAALRRELIGRGHVFRSRTDTEVIVHAYEEWGFACLERFCGMFAFALWDAPRRRLWLARDRLGIKPLFYAAGRDFFAFASELKGLLPHPGLGRALDYEALAHFLAFNWTPSPRTLLAEVRQLPPAHWLCLEADGRSELQRYWTPDYGEEADDGRPERYWREELAALLARVTGEHLVSDVPAGVFLSGGLDSSTIAYWAAQAGREPLRTFSVSFTEQSYDESAHARRVARQLGARHVEEQVRADAAAALPELVRHAEEPTADSSMLAVYYLARETRRHVTVAQSGDGADELLAGYATHRAGWPLRLYRCLPAGLRRGVVAPLVRALPVSLAKMSLENRLKRFVTGAELPDEAAHAHWRLVFDAVGREEVLRPVWDRPGARADGIELYAQHFSACPARHPLNRQLWLDTTLYLPNDMLVKLDRMTMAHSLEARVPFLDHRVVEFCARVPPELKLKWGLCGKYLLKRTMAGRLPAANVWRKKVGFNVPVGLWLKQSLRDFTRDHLSPSQLAKVGFIDPPAAQRLLDEHEAGRADHGYRLWGLLTLKLWHEQIIG